MATGNAVYVDCGHRPSDPGAVGNDLKEHDLNRLVATHVVAALKRAGVRVYTDLDIGDPGAAGSVPDSRKHPDVKLFLSQHHNGSGSRTARGIETYKTGSGRSLRFAKFVHSRLVHELRRVDATYVSRGVKEAVGTRAEYIVTRSQGASILLETGFVSSPKDAAVLRRSDYGTRAGETIARAIVDFGRAEKLWSVVYKPPTRTVYDVYVNNERVGTYLKQPIVRTTTRSVPA